MTGDVRAFSKRSILEESNDVAPAKQQRPKTVPVPKITLVSPDNSMTVTVLEDAQRLAKRRKLTLVKVSDLDSKTQRPVYKLMSSSVFIEEVREKIEDDHRDNQKFKDVKLHYISAKITEHDLLTKMKNVVKLLNKGHKVKIVITLDGSNEVSSLIFLTFSIFIFSIYSFSSVIEKLIYIIEINKLVKKVNQNIQNILFFLVINL